jgi:hypothetical protein
MGDKPCTVPLQAVREIDIAKVCGSPKNSGRHQIEELCKSINADMLRRIQGNIFHLQVCLELGLRHIEKVL